MNRSQTLVTIVAASIILAGCSNVGNMFGSKKPDITFDDIEAPDTKEVLQSRPKGLLPDRENVVHTGSTIAPQ